MIRSTLISALVLFQATASLFAQADLLFPVNPGVTTVSAMPGQSVTVTAEVANAGNAAAAATSIQFYLHSSVDLSQATSIGEVNVPALAAGATATGLTFTYTIPDGTAAGSYFLCSLIDRNGAVAESNEGNNGVCYSFSVLSSEQADLTVVNSTLSTGNAAQGQSVTMSFAVKNNGGFDSTATSAHFYLHTDDSVYSTTPIGSVTVPAIAAGATSSTLSFTYSVPADAPAGIRWFCTWVDAVGTVIETEDLNNGACFNFNVIDGGPDLRPSSPALSQPSGIAGETFNITLDVVNEGSSNAPASKVSFYFGTSTDLTRRTPIGEVSVPVLEAGAQASGLSFSHTIPTTTNPGTYFFCYVADGGQAIVEVDEADNAGCFAAVTIFAPTTPDLHATGSTLNKARFLSGDPVTFTLDVRNKNSSSGTTATSEISFYLGSSTDLTAATKLGETALAGIPGGATVNGVTFTGTIPESTPTGNYFFCYAIDSDGTVAESNEANNAGCFADVEVLNEAAGLAGANATVFPTTGLAGDSFKFNLDVINQGSIASVPTKVRMYMNLGAAAYDTDSQIAEFVLPALDPGSSHPIQLEYEVPSSTASGEYFISYWIDPENLVVERSDENNQGHWTISILNQAAGLMAVEGTSAISPVSGLVGDRFTMVLDVTNRGNTDSVQTEIYYYATLGQAGYDESNKVGQITLPALAPGEVAEDLTFSYLVPSTAEPGEYFFCYWIDAENKVPERSDENNQGCWESIRILDVAAGLSAASTSISARSGGPGDTITMKLTVLSGGNIASEPTKVFFYRSQGGGNFDLANKIGEIDLPALAIDATAELEFQYTLPNDIQAGTHDFCYWIDAPGLVIERQETNNQGCWENFEVFTDRPEVLASSSALSSTTGIAGDTFTMTLDITNVGFTNSAATEIFFYMTAGASGYASNSFVGSVPLAALAQNETAAGVTFSYTTPTTLPDGEYFFCYWIDNPNVVAELNEDNNQGCWAGVRIFNKAAGLAAAATQFSPTTGLRGDTLTMKLVVTNQGTSASIPTKVSFYKNLGGASQDPSDKIGEIALPEIQIGEASAELEFSYVVPAGTPVGSYEFCYWIDPDNLVPERSDENNFGCWANIQIVDRPDLHPVGSKITPIAGIPGDLFTMEVDIQNRGSASSTASKVFFYVNTVQADISTGLKIGEVALPQIAAGATHAALKFDYRLPLDAAAGNYNFCYWIDGQDDSIESNEENNQGCWSGIPVVDQAANLVPLNARLSPTLAVAGDTLVGQIDVHNAGNIASGVGVIRFYLNKNSASFENTALIGEIPLPSVNAGETQEGVEFTYTLPPGTEPGTYQMCYWVHPAEGVTEADPSDNRACWTDLTVVDRADLVSTSSAVSPLIGIPGAPFSLVLDVTNRGTEQSPATRIDFFLKKDGSSFDQSNKVAQLEIPKIGEGQALSELRVTYSVPADIEPGEYTFCYWIDPDNNVLESDDGNNQSCWPTVLIVRRPDLSHAESTIVPITGVPGDTFTMRLDVVNIGNDAAPGSVVHFFRSRDGESYDPANKIGQVSVPELSAGETASNLIFEHRLPETSAAGNYFFCYWVDAPGAVLEINDDNNQGCWANIRIVDEAELISKVNRITPTAGVPGETFIIELDIANTGKKASTTNAVSFFLAPNQESYSLVNRIGVTNIPPILPGQTLRNLTFAYTFPTNATFGTYVFSYWLDSGETVPEGNEENNRGTWSVPILNVADLIASESIISPVAAISGDQFTMTLAVTNRGLTASSASRVRFYLQKELTYNESDLIGAITLPSILPNTEIRDLIFTYIVPSHIPGGRYSICYWIDDPSLVAETNEENNKGCWTDILIEEIRFRPMPLIRTNTVNLFITGPTNFVYNIEASADLQTWSLLTTVTNMTGTAQVQDPVRVENKRRFYRAVLPPKTTPKP